MFLLRKVSSSYTTGRAGFSELISSSYTTAIYFIPYSEKKNLLTDSK
jgi:hypothetical protein